MIRKFFIYQIRSTMPTNHVWLFSSTKLKMFHQSVATIMVVWCLALSRTGKLRTDDHVLSVCLDGRHHLDKPRKTTLFGMCKPWESNTCCTNTTAYHAHHSSSALYNFNFNLCGNMSDNCMRRFTLNNCFYECSPNVGPWLKPDRSFIRNERFYYVPLCLSDCQAWWNDCKDDMTCADDWSNGFAWINKSNTCPTNSICRKFDDVFHNATNFCQRIFPDDYHVSNESTKCMTFNFTPGSNPNAKVAREYAVSLNMNTKIYGIPTTEDTSILQQNQTTVMIVVILLFVLACLGLTVYKTRGKFCPSRCSKGTRSATQQSADYRAFLQPEDVEESDFDVNLHGTLEIDL